MYILVSILAGLIPLIPAATFVRQNRKTTPVESSRHLILGLSRANLIVGLLAIGLGVISFLVPDVAYAAGLVQQTGSDSYASLGAGIAVGLGSLGAAIAVGNTGSAAIGVIAEKPESFGRVLIFVGLAEGVAIYGLIIAFILIS